MAMKRMVLEFGMGTDISGADPTKAALRALQDALSHNSLSIAPALGQPPEAMTIDVHIGVPHPDKVNEARVLAALPHGNGVSTLRNPSRPLLRRSWRLLEAIRSSGRPNRPAASQDLPSLPRGLPRYRIPCFRVAVLQAMRRCRPALLVSHRRRCDER